MSSGEKKHAEESITLKTRILLFTLSCSLLAAAPKMSLAQDVELRTVFCPIVAEAPTVDGVVQEEEWRGCTTVDALSHSRKPEDGTSKDTVIKLLADSSTLYIAFICGGDDGKPRTPKLAARDESPSTNNGVTVFLDLNHDHKSLNLFAVDYLGTQSDGVNPGTGPKGGNDQSWDADWRSAVTRGESSWTVECAIPIEALTGSAITPGRTVGINFLRRRPDLAHNVHLMTSPLASSRFYWAHAFADLVFGPPGVVVSKIDFPVWRQGRNTIGLELRNFGNTAETVDIAARMTSIAGQEDWGSQRVSLNPGGTARTELSGHLLGNWENRFDVTVTGTRTDKQTYSATYNQLNFGPASLQFATKEAMDERGALWNVRTGTDVCFQRQPFSVELSRSEPGSMEESLRVRTKLRSRDSGQLIKASEYRTPPGNKVAADVDTSGLPDGRYLFHVSVSDGDAELLNTVHQFVTVGEEFQDVKATLSDLRKSIGRHKERAESLSFSSSSFLYLEFLVEEAERLIGSSEIETYRTDFESARKLLAEAERRSEEFEQFRDPLLGKTGLLQRAFVSPYSREICPYTFFIPSSYDGSRLMPLVTDFLSSGPAPDWITSSPEAGRNWTPILELLEKKGFIMVWPGPPRRLESEVNFFAILEQMKQDYCIDADRIYLMGISGGGLTSWLIGLLYPDQIAAICPISAVSLYTVPSDWTFLDSTGLSGDGSAASAAAPHLESQVIVKASSTYYFPNNALHVPVLVLHGDADTSTLIDVQARPIVKKMRKLGLDVESVEYPGAGHGLGQDYPDGFARAMDFFEKHRNIRHPRTIDYTTPSLRYHNAYWIRIGRFQADGDFARVRADVTENTFTLKTENIARITILRDPEVFDVSAPVTVIVDGQHAFDGVMPDGGLGFARDQEGNWHVTKD